MSICKFCSRGDNRSSHEHCRQCSRGFRSRTALFNHLREYGHFEDDSRPPPKPTTPEPQYQCQVCNSGFKSRNKLFEHLKEAGHVANDSQSTITVAADTPGPTKKTCEICFNSFRSRNDLFAHIRESNHYAAAPALVDTAINVQAPSMPTCDVCYAVFNSRNALFAHLRETGHENAAHVLDTSHVPMPAQAPKRSTCTICWEDFESRNRLFAHINERHGSQHESTQQVHALINTVPNQYRNCGMQSPSRNKLMQHIQPEEHHRFSDDHDPVVQEEPVYQNDQYVQTSIEITDTTPSGNNELQCKNCFREFKSRNRLFAHIREMDHYEEAKEVV